MVESLPTVTIGVDGNVANASPAAKAAAMIEARRKQATEATESDEQPFSVNTDISAGWAPKKQMQFDEATAPIDDQERRAVQRRLQRQVEDERARKGLQTGRSTTGNTARGESGQSGKLTWRARASGYLSSRGLVSSRSTGGTARSMLSTTRSMMTTCRSDMATGRYEIAGAGNGKEITETRSLNLDSTLNTSLEDDARRRRAQAATAPSGKTPRTGKTPRSAAKTAAVLREKLARTQAQAGGKTTGRKMRA